MLFLKCRYECFDHHRLIRGGRGRTLVTYAASSPYRYLGAAEFWHPHPEVHTLNAAYYIAPDSSGLSLSAYKGQQFRFPNHRLSELAKVIGIAMDELKRHCGS